MSKEYLCHDCVGDPFVKERIKKEGSIRYCYRCHDRKMTVDLDELAEWVDPVYRENYQAGEEYPTFGTDDDSTTWETSGESPEDVISEILDIDPDIASRIAEILSKEEQYDVVKGGATPYYDSTSNYEPTPVSTYRHLELWDEFCYTVKHVSRFYNAAAIRILDGLFKEIGSLKHLGDHAPIRIIGPGSTETSVFRARQALSDDEIIRLSKLAYKEMGPPPRDKAVAGRMNAAGISVFYGTSDEQTCVSEIRMPVGGIAIVAKFEIIRPLRILDLTVLDRTYGRLSMFDPEFETKASHIKFLREFERNIRKPILAGDAALDYIPTQALAEYLANHYEPRIDAVIYSSAQVEGEGKNIVIFSHAATVEWPSEPKESARETFYRIMWGDDYCWITKDAPTGWASKHYGLDLSRSNDEEDYAISNDPTLRLVPDSITAVKVKSVRYDTQSMTVSFPPHKE